MAKNPSNAEIWRGLNDLKSALKEISNDLKPIPRTLENHEGRIKANNTLASNNQTKIDGFGNRITTALVAAVVSLVGIVWGFINPK